MNDSINNEVKNPWKDRAMLPQPRTGSLPLAFVALLLCSLVIPLCSYEWVPVAALALLFAYVVYAVRIPYVVTGLLLVAFLPTMLTSYLETGAIAIAITVGTGTLAFLLTVLRRPYLAFLPFVASVAIVWGWTGDAKLACLSLVVLPAGALLAIATVLGRKRTSAVCMTLFGLVAVLALILFLKLRQVCAEMGVTVAEYFEYLRAELLKLLLALKEELLATLDAQTMEQNAELLKLFSEELFVDLIASVFNLLPGILVLLCSILAFASQAFLNAQYRSVGMGAVVTPQALVFTMSVPAAILFIVSFFVNSFASGNSFAVAVVGNLYLMLLPGFCLIGLAALARLFSQMRKAGRFFFLAFLLAIACCSSGYIISFLGFWGAYHSIMDVVHRKLAGKMQPPASGGNQDGEQ